MRIWLVSRDSWRVSGGQAWCRGGRRAPSRTHATSRRRRSRYRSPSANWRSSDWALTALAGWDETALLRAAEELARQREDVVADGVLLAVVLVEAAGLRAVDEVVFQLDAGRALVGVEAPAAVGVGVDVVDDVVRDAELLDVAVERHGLLVRNLEIFALVVLRDV